MRKLFLFLTAVLFTTSLWGTATNYHDFVNAGDTIIDMEGSNSSTAVTKCTNLNGYDWINVSTSTKNATVKRIDPSTGATASSTSNVYGTKLGTGDAYKATFKVTGVTNVYFYVGGSSSRTGFLDVQANGESKITKAVTSAALSSSCSVMSYSLDKDKSYTLTLYASGDIFCYAAKFTVATKQTYTVTIDPNGGSYGETVPTGWTYDEGEDKYTKSGLRGSFDVPAGLTNGNKDLGWHNINGDTIILPITLTKDTTLKAQWKDHVTSNDATLKALSIDGCTLSPAFAPATMSYTVDLPFYASMPVVGNVTATKNDSHASDPVVSISGNVISIEVTPESGVGDKKTYTITVNETLPSTSINIEQWVLDNQRGKDDATGTVLAKDLLDAHNIGYVSLNSLDSLNDDPSKSARNEPYLGVKIKASDSQIKVRLAANKSLKVKFGQRGAKVNVAINGGSASEATITENVYTLTAESSAREVVFSLSKGSTTVFKQIMIDADIESVTLPWRVTYASYNKDTTSAIWRGTALSLPNVAATPENQRFVGWYRGDTAMVGLAGAEYTPIKNDTLVAHYATIYAVTFENPDNGTLAVKNGGIAINSGDKFVAGTVLTVETTPTNNNFALTALAAGEEDILSTKQFTVGTSDIIVAATFAEKDAAPISWSAETGKAYLPVGAKASVLPSLTNESSLTVAYSSTDEAKATIDASTGVITPVATGATTIKATYTATAEGAYKTTVAEYMLNVYGVKSMAISGDATVTEYAKNDAFDFAGLTATATFDDDETEDVTGVAEWLADPATITEAGNVNVTASLGGKTSAAKVVAVTITATGFDNTADETKAVKVLENGMLIIEKNGVRYNVTGQVIK